ncbi:hypothetical protein AMECASPLE_034989, partial [Ameca splendens]
MSYNMENGTREVMLQLDPIPGSAEGWNQNCDNHPKTEFYRKLAVCSIVCGCSCIGYKALENSLKAEYTNRPNEAKRHAQQAKKYGIISIATGIGILLSIPIIILLVSYLLTLKD